MNSQQPSEASGLNRDRADEVMKAKGLQALIRNDAGKHPLCHRIAIASQQLDDADLCHTTR